MKRTWKIVPFAALAALGVLALLSAGTTGGVPTASAEVTSVTVTPDPVAAGGTASIVVTAKETDAGDITVQVGLGTLLPVSCTIGGVACATFTTSGTGTSTVVITGATDGDATPSEVVTLTFTYTAPNLTTPTSIGVNATQAGVGQLVAFSVQPATTPTPTGTPATPTPTVTTTPAAAASITVSAAPTTIGCQGSAFITAVVRNAAGQNVADGIQVALSTTIGTISPATAPTLGGGVLAVLTAPANQGGVATITASVGTVTGSTTVQINCAQATATPVPATPTQPPIAPPATGDGGLAGTSSKTYLGILLLAVSLLGGVAVVRQRA
jgi:hypothetical protein